VKLRKGRFEVLTPAVQNTQVSLPVCCEYFPSFSRIIVPSTSKSCGLRRIPLDYVTWKREHFLLHPFRTSVNTCPETQCYILEALNLQIKKV